MGKKKQHTVQDALGVLLRDDSESDKDFYNPNRTPNNRHKKRDESSACGDSDSSESSNLVRVHA